MSSASAYPELINSASIVDLPGGLIARGRPGLARLVPPGCPRRRPVATTAVVGEAELVAAAPVRFVVAPCATCTRLAQRGDDRSAAAMRLRPLGGWHVRCTSGRQPRRKTMKTRKTKLTLNRESVRTLASAELAGAGGGVPINVSVDEACTYYCPSYYCTQGGYTCGRFCEQPLPY